MVATRFPPGMLLTVRPSARSGGPFLVTVDGGESGVGRVWDPTTDDLGPEIPFGTGYTSLLTPDGQWVVDLDDDGGSEVGLLVARSVDGATVRELTPGRAPYVLRGLDASADGSRLLASIVDDDGHHLLLVPLAELLAGREAGSRVLFSSPYEAWYGHLSADGRLASVDETSHNPGVRRAAVTVVDADSAEVVATADDLPAGPVRAVCFSRVTGDPRLLLSTERTGFARPALWDPVSGERVDYPLPDLRGEVLVLDWSPEAGAILVVEVRDGIQRLLTVDETSQAVTVVDDRPGSYAEPDVANTFTYYWQSHFAADGDIAVVASSWTTPLHLRRVSGGTDTEVVAAPPVPAGIPLASALVESADGTHVQLWWAAPEGAVRGTILDIHGGPNLASVDAYRPDLQAWLEHGYAVATLNYRGSVTFGRAVREGFWGGAGDREIEDVAATIAWLRTQGLADPASTFITGPSYGGHMSLLSVGRLPELFAGAFAIVAMADWSAAWPEMNPSLRFSWRSFLSMTPDGEFEPDRVDAALERFSSINHVDAVTASVWLFQGSRDTRTPPEQARSYAARLREAGGDVVIEWFDAGHEPVGIAGVETQFDRMLQLAEAKLAGQPWATTA